LLKPKSFSEIEEKLNIAKNSSDEDSEIAG
jgi:hypothetical protein